MTSLKRMAVSLLAATSMGGAALADMKTEIGPGEGQVDIVAWPGYIERGESDKNYDWVTDFEKATGCKVNIKTAATSDERRALVLQFLVDKKRLLKRYDPYIPGRKPRH